LPLLQIENRPFFVGAKYLEFPAEAAAGVDIVKKTRNLLLGSRDEKGFGMDLPVEKLIQRVGE
jgi:hypothetical protein